MTSIHPLHGRIATLATLHDKAVLIAPALARSVGLRVAVVNLDTDMLGTFTGEVPRPGTPLETVVAKARLSMTATGSTLALASEGVIGPHPDAPFITCDTEVVVLVDDGHGFAVHEIETAIGVPALSVDVAPGSIDEAQLHAAGFPSHGVIVRPTGTFDPVVKGVHDLEVLRDAVADCAKRSAMRTAHIESDFRANHHPVRREVIARAAQRLADRLTVLCSRCGTPGWGVVRRAPGAPCAACATPTSLTLAEIHGCAKCEMIETVRVADECGVDPARCPRCNP